MQKLPVDSKIEEIKAKLDSCPNLLFRSTPGSGKTTRIPPALLQASYHLNSKRKRILVLEPRRVAAKFSALRVADEMKSEVGKKVGYRFRFESRAGADTELVFITEGLLLRMLESDADLKDVSTVILDEFHERHLTTDLAIALLKRLQMTTRPDLRIVVLSATIEAEPILKYLAPCEFLELETVTHPIEIHYLDTKPNARIDDEVAKAVRLALANEKYDGDILVFLPGMKEIRFCETKLSHLYGSDRAIEILPLHGDIDRKEQDRAILPILGKTKIILSTNIAESSLTIENLTTIIDAGLERQAITNPWTGLTHLHTKNISKASAIQRTGRAGRVRPGQCYRLYSKQDFDTRQPSTRPEIKRIDLAETILDLANLNVTDFSTFPFFEAPEPNPMKAAFELLFRLDALTSASPQTEITPEGRKMAEFTLHPRISRALLETKTDGEKYWIAMLSALLNEDELTMQSYLEAKRGRTSFAVKRLFERILANLNLSLKGNPEELADTDLSRIFIHGFPDRVGRSRSENRNELTLSHGGAVKVDPRSGAVSPKNDFYLVLSQYNGISNFLLPLKEETLFDITHDGIKEIDHAFYDKNRDAVRATTQIRYGAIVLSETDLKGTDSKAVTEVLLKDAIGIKFQEIETLPLSDTIHRISTKLGRDDIEPWFARLKMIEKTDAEIKALVVSLFSKMKSLKEAKSFDVAVKFSEILDYETTARLEKECPMTLSMPRRKNTPIKYSLSQEPVLESRLQDFFGLKQTPTILNGRHKLKLSLLAPNYRPVQVTNDITGFFERTYPEVRKSLMRQYPKHQWPEKP